MQKRLSEKFGFRQPFFFVAVFIFFVFVDEKKLNVILL